MSQSENQLIQQLKEGNANALAELIVLYQDRIYNTALGILQNEHDAEEITQDVFIAVYQSAGGFREEAGLSTWMYKIVVRKSLDQLRKRKRKKRFAPVLSLLGIEEHENIKEEFNHPSVQMEQKENAAALFSALKKLPEQQQTAFVLSKLEGLSNREIATVMDTTTTAVESLLSRGKAGLRKCLAKYYEEMIKA